LICSRSDPIQFTCCAYITSAGRLARVLSKDIEVTESPLEEDLEPLKTVIGIKCTDGIVIASDSQATSKSQRTKTLGVSKIFQINDSSLLAGAADGGHIKILVEELKDQLSRAIFDNSKGFRNTVEQAI
jgi:20S proteasome alpha/beta subunit